MSLPAAVAPWLRPYAGLLARLQTASPAWRTAERLEALRRQSGAAAEVPVFVPHERLPAGEAYEAYIRRTGEVPTRDNDHDGFNGLVWWRFPATKARLNRLQATEIARLGVGARRGPVRDALTVFDENGALLHAPAALWDALRARDWRTLFVTQRAWWREAELVLFGHALLEQLQRPYKGLTAHVLCVPMPAVGADAGAGTGADPHPWDAALAACIDGWSGDTWAAKPFTPLPVLGIPGWWPDNADPSFYDDVRVFRPPRDPAAGATAATADARAAATAWR